MDLWSAGSIYTEKPGSRIEKPSWSAPWQGLTQSKSEDHDQPLFFHETLDVYRAGLDLVRWMVALPGATALPTGSHRQIDEAVTSILLNIAEGNGRYSEVDHRHFLDLAAAAAVKVAAGLDLSTRKGSWDRTACEPGKALLKRIMSMLSRM